MREYFDANGRLRRQLCMALFVLAFSLSIEAPCRARAEEAADEPVVLDTVIVDGKVSEEPALVERSFDTPEDATGFGETILAEPTWRSFETSAELLGESVGAQVRRQGGRDDFSTLSIRGAPSSQLRI